MAYLERRAAVDVTLGRGNLFEFGSGERGFSAATNRFQPLVRVDRVEGQPMRACSIGVVREQVTIVGTERQVEVDTKVRWAWQPFEKLSL